MGKKQQKPAKHKSARPATSTTQASGSDEAARSGRKKKAGQPEPETGSPANPPHEDLDFPIVGIGASAGGLKALQTLFDAIPADSDMALVVIQHLDPTKASLTAELLARRTSMKVAQVEEDVRIERNHAYVIPPNRYLSVCGGRLCLTEPEQQRGARVPIDFFLRSLADDQQHRAVAVILSGTGSDGTLGIKAIKDHGGTVIVQSPETAEHQGMPRSAIDTGVVDCVLPPAEIPAALVRYAQHPYVRQEEEAPPVKKVRTDLAAILDLLRSRTRFDFSCYKEATLLRRTRRRMGLRNLGAIAEYLEYLRQHNEEVEALSKDLLISVTDFFRDAEAWQLLQQRAIAPLVKAKGDDEPIRVWVPGCATGEEPYSLAILLFEELQKAGKTCPFQVFASDVNHHALNIARQGRYPTSIAGDVPSDRLRRFFTKQKGDDDYYQVNKALREAVVFADQNMIADPPFSKLDLLCCRNLLIYLKPETQQKVLALFHFALVKGGYLFLGSAETIGRQADLFEPVSQKWKIFQRIGPTRHDRVEFSMPGRREVDVASPPQPRDVRLAHLAQQRLLDWIAPSAVLINRQWEILYFCGDTDDYLTHSPGKPTQDLLSKARPGLRTKLRGAVQKALVENEIVSISTGIKRGGRFHPVQITARPVKDREQDEMLMLVVFEGMPDQVQQPQPGRLPRSRPAAVPGESGSSEIDTEEVVRHLEDELAASREDLHATIEQLESSNEEFKASNEEVMSINEELQSTNEELETSKEELQSLNEELNTVNSQLASKVEELESKNNDLGNLLKSTDVATVCLDTESRIKWFTPATTRIMRLMPTDVGRPLTDFSHKFTNEGLFDDAGQVLSELTPREKEVTADDGRSFLRRIMPYRTEDNHIEGVVITFVDVTEHKQVEERVYLAVEASPHAIVMFKDTGEIVLANATVEKLFGYSRHELLGQRIGELVPELKQHRQDHAKGLVSSDDDIAAVQREMLVLRKDGGELPVEIGLASVDTASGRHVLASIVDISRRKQAEDELRDRVELMSILRDVAVSANEAKTVEEAMHFALRRIGDYNRWIAGHVYRLVEDGRGRMVPSRISCINAALVKSAKKRAAIEKAFAGSVSGAENELVARAVSSGQPQWIDDVGEIKNWGYANSAQIGLHAAVAFPVVVEDEIVAVLEFFSDKPIAKELRFLDVMASVGMELGHLIERKRLEKAIANASSAQQRHFGRELHDGVAQELAGIAAIAEAARQKLDEAGSVAANELAEVTGHLKRAQTQVRRLSRGLMPVDVDSLGLKLALEELAEYSQQYSRVECVLRCGGDTSVRNNDMATHLYRIAQEAIHNSIRHAKPKRIEIVLEKEDHHLRLTIRDDGQGMNQTAPTTGTGQRIMRYRADLIGGKLEIDSRPKQGTTVTCAVENLEETDAERGGGLEPV